MTRHGCKRLGFVLLVATVLFSAVSAADLDRERDDGALATAAPPPLDMPLIKFISPRAAQEGQKVLIGGVNFGSNPTVSFNGALTGGSTYVPSLGVLFVTVPDDASSGPLVVNNTDTTMASNAASFELLGGIYTPACTITGSVTNESMQDVAGALVVAIDSTENFADIATTNTLGDYSLAIDPSGTYFVGVFPPAGAPYYDTFYVASCPGTQDHQFSPGIELFGRVVSSTPTPIANALVSVASTTEGYEGEVLTDAGGNFGLFVPSDTYDVFVEAPIGGPYISTIAGPVDASVNPNLGDLVLDSGVIVSGELRYRDGLESGPLSDTDVRGFDGGAGEVGFTTSIADGSFYLAVPPSSILVLAVDQDGFEPVLVNRLEQVTGDVQLEFPVDLFSSAAQLPELPTISGADALILQPGQRLGFEVTHKRGTTVDVRFSDGLGGQVDGLNTYSVPDLPWLATTVPATAETGDVVLRVDGTDGPGFPVQIDTGTFDPGPNTTSGIITDAAGPVEGVLVAAIEATGREFVIDYDMTDGTGAYTVHHGTQARQLAFVPPLASGLLSIAEFIPESTGSQTLNVRLLPGSVLSGSCVDSGFGPVASPGPISDCVAEVNQFGFGEEYEEDVLSGEMGQFAMPLPDGESDLIIHGPFQSRYLAAPGDPVTVHGATDAGARELDSGYFVYGRVVDPGGAGLAGVEVVLFEGTTGFSAGTQTVKDGYFRVAVQPGSDYSFFFRANPDIEYFVPPVFGRSVFGDTMLYPPARAELVGHLQGTVRDDSMAPLGNIPISVWHDIYGPVDWTDTRSDGTYDLRAPSGDFTIHATPTEEDLCLANEAFDGRYEGCGADIVSMTAPAVVLGKDFVLEPAGALTGEVRDDFGVPLEGVTVCAEAGDSLPYCFLLCTTTEFDGSYELAGIPVASDYKVYVSGPGQPLECWDGHLSCVDYDPVAVSECAYAPVEFWCGLLLAGAGPTSLEFRAPFDVVTGIISELRADRDFARAECLGEFPTSPGVDSLPAPPVGDGRYYLARSSSASCGAGYGRSSLVPDPRDDLVTTPLCP